MSEQEKDQIVGRLAREAGELRRTGEFIRKEMELAINSLDCMIASLRPRASRVTKSSLVIDEYARKYVDLTKLLDLVKKQDETATRIEEVRIQMESMGA